MAEKKTKKDSTAKQAKASKKEAQVSAPENEVKIKARLADSYKNEIVPALMNKFGYKSIMQVPKLDKIVVNMGVGDAVSDSKLMDEAVKELKQ